MRSKLLESKRTRRLSPQSLSKSQVILIMHVIKIKFIDLIVWFLYSWGTMFTVEDFTHTIKEILGLDLVIGEDESFITKRKIRNFNSWL